MGKDCHFRMLLLKTKGHKPHESVMVTTTHENINQKGTKINPLG